jgi:hypothetical protein
MNDTAYLLVRRILGAFLWDGELVGEENLQKGPAVVVANHLGAKGPIGVFCSMPMRLYPWIQMETLDKELAPNYIRLDFVEKELHLKPPLSIQVAKAIGKISVPLLRSIGPVPVYHHRQGLEETLQQSLTLLLEGKVLFISPEDTDLDPDPGTGIHPFQNGFLRLGELYAKKTHQQLQFYPVTVHEAGLILIDKPLAYNFDNEARRERIRLANLLETTIKARYVEITTAKEVGQRIGSKKPLI